MKTIEELINTEEPGWDLVLEWKKDATNAVEVLPKNLDSAKQNLLALQVTTRSPMGAIIYETGGLLIDNSWIRVLGSGSDKLNRSISSWNDGKSEQYLLVADDIIGGYFAINAGGLGEGSGNMFYLPQDTLEWEDMEMSYSEFLYWCFHGDLELFYQGFRWDTWKEDAKALDGNQVYAFYPMLWSEEGQRNTQKLTRKPVSIEENFQLTLDFQNKINNNL